MLYADGGKFETNGGMEMMDDRRVIGDGKQQCNSDSYLDVRGSHPGSKIVYITCSGLKNFISW